MTNLPTTIEELEDLAKTGGIALVGAMATETFRAARSGIARLFARREPAKRESTEAQLDEDEALVADAAEDERDEVRDELARIWRRRLTRLLNGDPDARQDLRDLIEHLRTELPDGPQEWVQTNIARDHSTQFAVQGGKQEINYLGFGGSGDERSK